MEKKLPLQLLPKMFWDLERLQNIDAALESYRVAEKVTPKEWLEERDFLLKVIPKGFREVFYK